MKQEILATIGLTLVVSGVWFIYRPAALITAGLLLFGYAFITANPRAAAPKPKQEETT